MSCTKKEQLPIFAGNKLLSIAANGRKYFSLVGVIAIIISAGFGIYPGYSATQPDKPLKIGFITVGPKSDWGYNFAHDQGRLYMQAHMQGKVVTEIAENIPESAEVERVMEKMIAGGDRLIFPTSYGYYDPVLRVAARHPEVLFEQCGRLDLHGTKNLATYFAKIYEPVYLSGLVAGRLTKKNNIGIVAAHPIPQVLLNINAFTLGARSVNNKVKVHVIWTNKWSDAPTEAEAAKSLIDAGADVLTMHLDSPLTVVQTAEKYGVYVCGYHADVHKFAPKGWLTGAMWNWGPLYENIANSVIDHKWKPGNYRYSMKDGCAKLSPFGNAVPKAVQQEALTMKDRIASGQYVVFQGPLKTREGKEILAAGQMPTVDMLETMNFFVSGIEGTLPKN